MSYARWLRPLRAVSPGASRAPSPSHSAPPRRRTRERPRNGRTFWPRRMTTSRHHEWRSSNGTGSGITPTKLPSAARLTIPISAGRGPASSDRLTVTCRLVDVSLHRPPPGRSRVWFPDSWTAKTARAMSSRSCPEVARRQHWEPTPLDRSLLRFSFPRRSPDRPGPRRAWTVRMALWSARHRWAGNDRLFRRHDRPLRRKPEPRRKQGGQRHERSRAVADRVGPGHRSDARRRSRIASGRTRRRGHEPIPQGDRSRLLEHGRDHRQPAAGGDGECRRQARPGPARP